MLLRIPVKQLFLNQHYLSKGLLTRTDIKENWEPKHISKKAKPALYKSECLKLMNSFENNEWVKITQCPNGLGLEARQQIDMLNIGQFLKAFQGDIWLCKPAQDNTSQITIVIEDEGDEVEDDGIVYGLMYYVSTANHRSDLRILDPYQTILSRNIKDWLFH